MTPAKKALTFAVVMALGALAVFAFASRGAQPQFDYRFWALLGLTLATARLKVKLPGLTGNMAVNLPFVLITVTQLSLLEALLVAVPACALQCFPKGFGKPKPVQMLFNLSTTAVAVAAGSLLTSHFAMVLGAAGLFLAQTLPVAAIIRLTEGGAIHQIWTKIAHYSFPFYVLSAGLTSMAVSATPQLGLQIALLGLPVLYAIYRSYESYFRQPESAILSH